MARQSRRIQPRAIGAGSGYGWALGFLSKYTALFQYLSWALFFVLWPPARKQLHRPGPYLALMINLLCALPVLIWNYQHGWITVEHVAGDGNLQRAWDFSPAGLWHNFTRYSLSFVGAELVILNPFFVIPALWAAVVFWQRKRRNTLLVYFFSMAVPITVCYFLLTFHSGVQPNWIVPAVLPLFCLAVVYWDERWRAGLRTIRVLAFLRDGRGLPGGHLAAQYELDRKNHRTSATTQLGYDATRHRLEGHRRHC